MPGTGSARRARAASSCASSACCAPGGWPRDRADPAGRAAGPGRPGRGGHVSAPGYPLALDLTGRAVVVVGGGQVALRRARALTEAGALVTVIAPRVRPEFADLGVRVIRR